MSKIITIGRQYGSGGRALGKMLSEMLNIPLYDKELVELAAKESNVSLEAVKEIDERTSSSLLYSLVTGGWGARGLSAPLFYEMPINDKFFIAQAKVIKELAQKGDCIIVGRCADYVLADTDHDVFNVFVYADMDYRINFAVENLDVKPEKAKDTINKTDKQRKTYYDYYTDKSWGEMTSYDLCINVAKTNMDKAAKIVCDCFKDK